MTFKTNSHFQLRHFSLFCHILLICRSVASLLEMMLDSSLSDLRVAQGVALPFCPSLVRLLRLLQDFLFAEGTDNHSLWSEKVSNKNTTKVQKWSGCLHLQRVGRKQQTLSLCNLRTPFFTKTEAGVLLLSITTYQSKAGHTFVFYKYTQVEFT